MPKLYKGKTKMTSCQTSSALSCFVLIQKVSDLGYKNLIDVYNFIVSKSEIYLEKQKKGIVTFLKLKFNFFKGGPGQSILTFCLNSEYRN